MLKFVKRAYEKYWESRLQQMANLPPSTLTTPALNEAMHKIFQERGLPFTPIPEAPSDRCQHKYTFSNEFCGRRLLDDSNFCIWHHRSTNKYQPDVIKRYFGESLTFKDAIEREVKSGASLSGAYLEEAPLHGSWYHCGANLQGADLSSAEMMKAHLSYGSLRGANLMAANLEFAYLSNVDLNDANLTSAQLFEAKFRGNDFSRVKGLEKGCFRNWNSGGVIPKYRMLEEYPDQAEPMYRALMTYFTTMGAIDDASWAAYRNRIMHQMLLKKKIRLKSSIFEEIARQQINTGRINFRRAVENGVITWILCLVEFVMSWINRWIWGYGEKPIRVAAFAVIIIMLYAVIYDSCNVLLIDSKGVGFLDSLYFSIVTFTTLGYGDLVPQAGFRLLAASEALSGLVLSGLFLFTLSRRSVGRA